MLNEDRIIDAFKTAFSVQGGIGDDAAVIAIDEKKSMVITKDLLVEDVHFRRRYYSPEELAHKSLHVNLSDIAAMGAVPAHVFLGISLPKSEGEYATAFTKHFIDTCKNYNVVVMGGDTTSSKAGMFISVTMMGYADNAQIKLRTTANIDDVICVAGDIGHAHIGLLALESDRSGFAKYEQSAKKPMARIAEGAWFGGRPDVTAMMDLSDGLYVDVQKLARASSVTADIYVDEISISDDFRNACAVLDVDPIKVKLEGGEDYGLLITVHKAAYADLARDFQQKFGYALQPVGSFAAHGNDNLSYVRVHSTVSGNAVTDIKPFSHF